MAMAAYIVGMQMRREATRSDRGNYPPMRIVHCPARKPGAPPLPSSLPLAFSAEFHQLPNKRTQWNAFLRKSGLSATKKEDVAGRRALEVAFRDRTLRRKLALVTEWLQINRTFSDELIY